jgi:hypothetical protein
MWIEYSMTIEGDSGLNNEFDDTRNLSPSRLNVDQIASEIATGLGFNDLDDFRSKPISYYGEVMDRIWNGNIPLPDGVSQRQAADIVSKIQKRRAGSVHQQDFGLKPIQRRRR